jgi:hypothetical protein
MRGISIHRLPGENLISDADNACPSHKRRILIFALPGNKRNPSLPCRRVPERIEAAQAVVFQ